MTVPDIAGRDVLRRAEPPADELAVEGALVPGPGELEPSGPWPDPPTPGPLPRPDEWDWTKPVDI